VTEPSHILNPLEDTIRLLRRPGRDAEPGLEVRGIGQAEGGRVRAEVSAAGRLETLDIDPTLTRSGSAVVAELVVEAVRAAQDDVQHQVAEVLQDAASRFDPAGLTTGLDAVATEASRGLSRMIGELDAVTRRFEGR
jgi:DNA-binding protein YbaB